ncbi:hypothetical protein B0H16DRAFT_1635685 [Mycena metata]|uniref:Uncharacterized protein n=1 Tax=Mycena metata TaxID=1033252 RepID=A0AAD7M8T2_9AGAR|nr:hypothetical protein B0H16DRAFT_1635685 [Mycena metata]
MLSGNDFPYMTGYAAWLGLGEKIMGEDGLNFDMDKVPAFLVSYRSLAQPATIPIFPLLKDEYYDIADYTRIEQSSIYFLNCPPLHRLLPLLRSLGRIEQVELQWVEEMLDRAVPYLVPNFYPGPTCSDNSALTNQKHQRIFGEIFPYLKQTPLQHRLLKSVATIVLAFPEEKHIRWMSLIPLSQEALHAACPLELGFRFCPNSESLEPPTSFEPMRIPRDFFEYLTTVPGAAIRALAMVLADRESAMPVEQVIKLISDSQVALMMLKCTHSSYSFASPILEFFNSLRGLIADIDQSLVNPSWADTMIAPSEEVTRLVPHGFYLPTYNTRYTAPQNYPTRRAPPFPDHLANWWKKTFPDIWVDVMESKPKLPDSPYITLLRQNSRAKKSKATSTIIVRKRIETQQSPNATSASPTTRKKSKAAMERLLTTGRPIINMTTDHAASEDCRLSAGEAKSHTGNKRKASATSVLGKDRGRNRGDKRMRVQT